MRSYNDLVDLFFEYIDYLKNNQAPNFTGSYLDKEFDLLFNNKTLFDRFYNDVVNQNVYNSYDNIRLFNMFTDWYSSLSNIITQHQFSNNALQATTNSLDDLIHSYGMPYYYWLPNSNKSLFFLDQVKTYHIKGSAQAISSSLAYFLNIENEIYEYWINYDKGHNSLYFKGYPAIKNNDIHNIVPYILKDYVTMEKEPHWYYTESGIIYKQNQTYLTNSTVPQAKLPSMSPYFDVVMAMKLEETKKAYLYISYLAWCQLQKWISTGDISDERVWEYKPSNQKLSILEIILAYDILYNKKYDRILTEDLTTGRDTYNVACGKDKDEFESDYDDAFGIIDITNTRHDDFVIENLRYGGDDDRLETIVIEDKLKTKNQPVIKLQETNAIIYDMKAIIPGGLDNTNTPNNKCIRFDLYNQKWDEPNYHLPKPLRNHCVVQNDNFMIIIGGIDDNNEYNKHIYVLDLLDEQWYQMPYDFPLALIDFSYVLLKEYELFIVSGFDLSTASWSNKTYKFNLIRGDLKELDDFPGTPVVKMGLSIDQQKRRILMSGGWNRHLAYSQTYIYDLRDEMYITAPNDLEKRACNYIIYDGERNFVNLGGLKMVDNLSENYIESIIDDIIYQFGYRRGQLYVPEKVQTNENYDFDPNETYDDYVIIENPLLTVVDINTLVQYDVPIDVNYNDENNYRPTEDTEHDRNHINYELNYLEINEYVPYYLQYIDTMRLFYKPIFHETKFSLALFNWSTLSYDSYDVIIDSSYPNVQHLYHNVFILQPLVSIIDPATGLQTGLEVSNDVYVKRFVKQDRNWFDFREAIIHTLDDPTNTSRREEYETKLGVRMAKFSKNSPMFVNTESDNEDLLLQINPDLYTFIMDTINAPDDKYNEAIYYLLADLDDIAGYYGYETNFRLLNINAIQELLTKIVDFYKPIHSRQMVSAVIVLPFDNRTYNTVYIDDYLRIMANIYGEDFYSVEDNYKMKIYFDLYEKMQWAYNYDLWFPDYAYNEWDWYTVYEEYYFGIKLERDEHVIIDDDMEFTMNSSIEENVDISEDIIPRINIVGNERIGFANNYDENLEYDNYYIQENLDIQIINV